LNNMCYDGVVSMMCMYEVLTLKLMSRMPPHLKLLKELLECFEQFGKKCKI
jgi:hypothetical protein